MANWPTTLALPLLDGYGIKPQSSVLRTQMEAGPARYRQRFTAVPYDVSVSVSLTKEQMAIFKSFYEDTIHFGADWFLMSGLDLGNGYTTDSEVHMVGEPDESRSNQLWRVKFNLEVRNA